MTVGVPTLSDFQTFITSVMGISTSVLPSNSPVITWSFDFAYDWVAQELSGLTAQPGSWTMYQRAVYNLAADTLINWAQDTPPSTYFANLRKDFGCNSFVAGVIQSSSDEGTSESLLVPEAFARLTIANLGNLKTPYGRAYLGIAQSFGPVWGLS